MVQRHFFNIVIFLFFLFSSSVLAHEKDRAFAYQTYISRGNFYADKGQHDKAIEEYKNAIDLNPSDPIAYYMRGITYCKKGQYGKGIEDYNRAIDLKPDKAIAYQIYVSRGEFYGNKGQHERAVEDLRKAIALNPENPRAYTKLWRVHYNYGNVSKRKGQYDKAIEEYSAAIGLTPNNPHPYTGRGYIYILKGDKKSAIIDLQSACDLGDKNACHILEILKSN